MILHTDGNMHALDAHERSGTDTEFAALAKRVEAALIGQKYYELHWEKDGVIVERTVADAEVHEEHRGLLRVTLDDAVACWVSDPTCEIHIFANDDIYYVTREEAEEALREMSE